MKAKIAKFLKFFEFFCIYHEDLDSSKFNFYIKKFNRIFWFSVSIFFILQSIYFAFVTNNFHDFDFAAHFRIFFYVQVVGFLILILSFKKRKKEQKILKNLSEVEELLKDFLDVKTDWIKFVRESWLKIAFQLAFTCSISIFRKMNDSKIYFFGNQIPTQEVSLILTHFSMRI